MRTLLGALLATLAFVHAALAHDLGPAPGRMLPTLAGAQTGGAPATFERLTGERGLVLVFTRSVDWCPYCQRQAIELQAALPELQRRGYNLALISTDDAAKQAAFAERRGISYPLLADPASQAVDAFALRDPAFPAGHRVHGVPVPTIFVTDARGRITTKLGELDYRVRPTVDALIESLDQAR